MYMITYPIKVTPRGHQVQEGARDRYKIGNIALHVKVDGVPIVYNRRMFVV
jgi:hypothetical protein